MDQVSRLNNLASDYRLSGFSPFAVGAAVILDENNDLAFDPRGNGSPTPYTKRFRFNQALIAGLSGTSGDLPIVVPARAVVLTTTVKHQAALDAAAKATGTLTSNNTNVSDAATVTIGTKVYTFKTALTPTEGEVLIGADADASLLNLIRAINHTGTSGTDYSVAVANTQVSAAASVTSHAFLITALLGGTAGNAIATTETAAGAILSFGAATLTGGAATGGVATATARLISAQNNYGTAFNVAQAAGAEVFDFFATPKSELMGGPSTINMHLAVTGTTLDLITVGTIDAWLTWFIRP